MEEGLKKAAGSKDAPVDTIVTPAYETAEERRAAAAMSVLDRQTRIEMMLVEYPLFNEAVAAMRGHHMPVTGGRHLRGQVCGIIGVPRTGKSTAIRHYVERCGPVARTDVKGVNRIAYVDCHENWNASDLAAALYRAVGFGAVPRHRIEVLFEAVAYEIEAVGIEAIVIDDAQWAIAVNDTVMRRHAFGLIVGLAERKVCNVVLSGTMAVLEAALAHPHLRGRGQFPKKIIKPYSYGDTQDREAFAFLLQAIDDRLPFKESSRLARPSYLPHFFKISEGSMGNLMDYIRAAALKALEADADRIEIGHIRDSVEERYEAKGDYVPFETTIDLAAIAKREAAKALFEEQRAKDVHFKPSRPSTLRGPGA